MDNVEIMWGLPISAEPIAKYSTADADRIIGFACPMCGCDIEEGIKACPQCNSVLNWFIFELAKEVLEKVAAQTNISE